VAGIAAIRAIVLARTWWFRPSERLVWIADVVDPAPDERVLELGCGRGDLIALLAERAPRGKLVGVDPSPTMIAAATRRNRAAVESGLVCLQTADLRDADLGTGRFDVVVSVNVRTFLTPPAPEWDVVARVLAPEGRVLVAFSPMSRCAERPVLDAVDRLAGERHLGVGMVHRARTGQVDSVAVELRRHPRG
jgi:SAM-dependent methyltransferase